MEYRGATNQQEKRGWKAQSVKDLNRMTKEKHSRVRTGNVYALLIRKHEWAILLIVAVGKDPRLQGRVARPIGIIDSKLENAVKYRGSD